MVTSKLIPSVWEVPAHFHTRLGDRPGRQRALVHEGHLLLVLHEAPHRAQKSRQARLFYRKPDGTWLATAHRGGLAAIQQHVQEFEQQIDQLDLREDQAQTADDYFRLMEALSPLKRSVANLHTTLEEARKQVPDARELINLRDFAYDVARSAELLWESLQAGATIAQVRQAEVQAQLSRQLNESAHRLNLLAAFFIPLVTLATIFSMQLPSGLESVASPWPFSIVCATGALMGFLIYLLLGRKASHKTSTNRAASEKRL